MDEEILYITYKKKKLLPQSVWTKVFGERNKYAASFQIGYVFESLVCCVCVEAKELEAFREKGFLRWFQKEFIKWKQENIPARLQNPDLWLEPELAEYFDTYPREYSSEFLDGIFHAQPQTERVYMRGLDGEGAIPFLKNVFLNLNQLIWLEKETVLQEEMKLFSDIYEQTGLLVKCCDSLLQESEMEKNRWKTRYATLFFDWKEEVPTYYRNIPYNTIYIDLKPNKKKKRIFTEKRRDITYVTYADYLDI